MDLKAEYRQIPLEEGSKVKTAFRISSGHLCKSEVFSFRLCTGNASTTFLQFMEITLCSLAWEIFLSYLDDVLVLGESWPQMLRFRGDLSHICKAGWKLNPKQYDLVCWKVPFLGQCGSVKELLANPELLPHETYNSALVNETCVVF